MSQSQAVAPTNPVEWIRYVEDFRRAAHEAVDWIAEYLANTRDYPVVATTKPGALVDALPPSGPGNRTAAIPARRP